jgi:hypothetical protein
MESSHQIKGRARLGLSLHDKIGQPLFICSNEASNNNPIEVSGNVQFICEIKKFPITSGKYKISLFIEVEGIVEDWIESGINVEVQDGFFHETSKNTPDGWTEKTVLIDHVWKVSENTSECRSVEAR